MEIEVKRLWTVPGTTTGVLLIDGRQVCFTLEDEVREVVGLDVAAWKVQNETAIPRGRYQVLMSWSNRLSKMLPELLEVPGFTKIRIHGGNRANDTEGCICVGEQRLDDQTIVNCSSALLAVISLVEQATANNEQVWVEVT